MAHQNLQRNFAMSFETGWCSQDFELPGLKQVEACEPCDLKPPALEVSWHLKLKAADMNNLQATDMNNLQALIYWVS